MNSEHDYLSLRDRLRRGMDGVSIFGSRRDSLARSQGFDLPLILTPLNLLEQLLPGSTQLIIGELPTNDFRPLAFIDESESPGHNTHDLGE